MLGDDDRHSALDLLLLAESYVEAARHLLAGLEKSDLELRFEHPLFFLMAQGYELIFKAAQKTQRGQHDQSRDLSELWKDPQLKMLAAQMQAIVKGWQSESMQSMALDFEKNLDLLSGFFSGTDFDPRRFSRGAFTVPNLKFMIYSADNLIGYLKPLCEEGGE